MEASRPESWPRFLANDSETSSAIAVFLLFSVCGRREDTKYSSNGIRMLALVSSAAESAKR